MSYEKLGFEKGQVLKAEHLNHMEEGIEAANASSNGKVLILNVTSVVSMKENCYYNGEKVDGDFLLDCLLSGYDLIVEYNGDYYSVYEWHVLYNELCINTIDNSLRAKFNITTA